MRIAIAGSGDATRYISEELASAGIDVVILTRIPKPHFENRPHIQQIVTDYNSLPSLLKNIEGCTTLISTILDYTPEYTAVHNRLIEACKQSQTCKRFIPSEYGGNVRDFPDQPGFYYRHHGPVREALETQSELEWTIVCVGWLSDYLVPSKNRYMKDIDEAFPVNLKTKEILIPGTGNEPVNFTSARDMARAIVNLVQAPKGSWEKYTWVSGERASWNVVADVVRERYPDLKVVGYRSLYQLVKDLVTAGDNEEAQLLAEFRIFSVSGAGGLDEGEVLRQREKFFEGIRFRGLREVMEEAERKPDSIV